MSVEVEAEGVEAEAQLLSVQLARSVLVHCLERPLHLVRQLSRGKGLGGGGKGI